MGIAPHVVLAERALRIAAETANSLGTTPPASASLHIPSIHQPETAPENPPAVAPFEKVQEERKPVAAPPPVAKVPEETPQVVPDWAANTRTAPPLAPKVVAPPVPPAPVTPAEPVIASPPPSPPVPVHAEPYFPMSTARPPRKSMGERMRSALALEEILGTNWLNKIGIIFVVLGVASFGIYELGQLGPWGKVGLSLAVALTLLIGGIYLSAKNVTKFSVHRHRRRMGAALLHQLRAQSCPRHARS